MRKNYKNNGRRKNICKYILVKSLLIIKGINNIPNKPTYYKTKYYCNN